MTPAGLHASIRESDTLISRLREIDYGDAWINRSISQPVLLEVGSGWGATLAAAGWRGFETFGIEPDAAQAEWARNRLGVMVFPSLGDVPKVPTDVVVISGFSRYAQPVELLDGLVERLVPGGLLVITAPMLDHPLHQARGGADPMWKAPEHSLLFERSGLSMLLIRSGLLPERAWHHPTRMGEAVIVARRS